MAREASPQPLITDRPDFTESTASVEPGRLQLEAGYTFSRDGLAELHTIGELLLRIGVFEDIELRLGAGSYTRIDGPARVRGREDTEIGLKWTVADEAVSPAVPSVAILAGTSLPTGDDELGQNGLQPSITLALAWTLSDRISFATNLNGAYSRDSGDRFADLSGSVALGAGVTDRIGAFMEVFGFAAEDRPENAFMNGGITYLLTESLQLDVRAGIGLDDPRPNYFTGAGVAWRR